MSRFSLLIGSGVACLLLLVLAAQASAPGQTSCLALDENVLAYAVELATATDTSTAADRAAFNIPAVAASEVEYIGDEATCKSAGREYKTAAGLKGKSPAVLVIRIGTRYLVSSPASQTDKSEFILYVVMDEQFNRLAAFAS